MFAAVLDSGRKRMVGLEPTASCMATRPDYRNLDHEPHG